VEHRSASEPFFQTRGVVLTPEDLTLRDWVERAKRAGLTTIALHHSRSLSVVVDFVRSDEGQTFLEQCRDWGLQVEYELHAINELLPRELFEKDASLFRMDENGERTLDCNLCVHSKRAMEVVAENALTVCERLRPTTHRYFLWGDDGRPWCGCPKCVELSESDQALLLENQLIETLRRKDLQARLAHLAYHNTLQPPTQVKPAAGIFLEFAPIRRRFDVPLSSDDPTNVQHLEALEANLKVFGTDGAQALEYWLDVSMFSRWKKPAVKLPFNREAFAADLDTYGSRGVQHVTSFAVFIDADYVARHGEPPLDEYGMGLTRW
jgi:hypothetical protein